MSSISTVCCIQTTLRLPRPSQSKRKPLPHGRTGPDGQKKARHLELQERFLARPELQRDDEVDPMLPGGKSGKWSDGLNIDGERAADTTASGQCVFPNLSFVRFVCNRVCPINVQARCSNSDRTPLRALF